MRVRVRARKDIDHEDDRYGSSDAVVGGGLESASVVP